MRLLRQSIERNRRRLRTECEKLGKRQEPAKGTEKRATSVGAETTAAGPGSQREVHQRGGMIGRLSRVFWRTEARSMASMG